MIGIISLNEQIACLYHGAEFVDVEDEKRHKFRGIEFMFMEAHITTHLNFGIPLRRVRFLLRPITQITEDEYCSIFPDSTITHQSFVDMYESGKRFAYTPEQTLKLLNKYFDILGLIESGLAYDSKKYFSTIRNEATVI